MLKQLTFVTSPLLFTWVKNVYSLGTQTGTTSAQLPTAHAHSDTYSHMAVHKSPVVQTFIHRFKTYLSPSKKGNFNLLNDHLYPQSTAPINNQNERKIGKE